MSKKRSGIIGIILAVAAVAAVFYAEQVLQPVYAVKSLCKVAAFGSTVWIYKLLSGERILSVICLHKMKHAKVLLLSMRGCFFGIAVLFFLFHNQLDMQSIKTSLMTKENLTRQNCLFVFAYIIVINSFVEEAFFRGFIFHLFSNKIACAIFRIIQLFLEIKRRISSIWLPEIMVHIIRE